MGLDHTPGPWTVETYAAGNFVIHHDEDNRICFLATPGEKGSDIEQIEANAHLIAAAPALLRAVYQAANYIDDQLDQSELRQKAQMAIFQALELVDAKTVRTESN